MRTTRKRLNTHGCDRPDHITIQCTLHNHPSGNLKPSEADLKITKRVAAAAQILQIYFLDHVIVGQGFFSFKEAGLL
jgi:DNA repair protein RadC